MRGYRLSLQTVWLQSPVSNLNLLCHLKSPWTNLTLACNNRLQECLSVPWVCVCLCACVCTYVTTGLPALIMVLEDYDSTHTHTEQKINQNYTQPHVCRACRHISGHTDLQVTLALRFYLLTGNSNHLMLLNKSPTNVWPHVDVFT